MEAYTSLAHLIKDDRASYSGNTGFFYPQINHIDQSQLDDMDWHKFIGQACMGNKRLKQYTNLEDCLNPGWEITPQEISIPSIVGGRKILPGNRVYIALGSLPQMPKLVGIAFDQPEDEAGTISHYLSRLHSTARNIFRAEMGWVNS